jgi:tRNA uridine 5-carboxymethylaminomethyl modification enzyme
MHAAAAALGVRPAPLDRANSYLAVMVDDLTLHGVSEPYRMLTARAEYRLRLRSSNAATRLTPLGIAAGCVSEQRRAWFEVRQARRERWEAALDAEVTATALAEAGVGVALDGARRALRDWLRCGGIELGDLRAWLPAGFDPADPVGCEAAEDAMYAPYLARQDAELRELRASDAISLGAGFPYRAVPGLSHEMVERLEAAQPATLAAAGRIAGITPAALAVLLVHARRRLVCAA